ncbi:hypothetical protein [Limosilactobacillus sp.]|uniref:hypothetical protein n=1 Tax=Limosilactobacillus sp. TaxID=2773925 RepID=UPI00345F0DB4
MHKKLLRSAVYNSIWSSSVKASAEKYGVDYTELLNVCHQSDIPIPGPKYHLALVSGQDVTKLRAKLPTSANKFILVKDKNVIATRQHDKQILDPNEIKRQFEFLNDPIKVQKISNALDKAIQRKNWPITPEVKAYKISVKQWKNAEHSRNQYHYNYEQTQSPKFVNELSKRGMQRACRLLNRLVNVLKWAGAKVGTDLSVKIDQDEITYEIKEDQDQVPHQIIKQEQKELSKYEEEREKYDWVTRPQIRKYDHPYNGHLRIRFVVSGKYKRFVKDTSNAPLEEQLPEIIMAFYRTYIETKNEREKLEAEERARKEEEHRRELCHHQIDEEKKRVVALINEVKDYRLANDMRDYIDAIEDTDIDPAKISWMRSIANWIDPLISGDDQYLEKRVHGDSDEKKAEYLGEDNLKHSSFYII